VSSVSGFEISIVAVFSLQSSAVGKMTVRMEAREELAQHGRVAYSTSLTAWYALQ